MGIGAWSLGFYRFGMTPTSNRQRRGIVAFKKELVYNGFADGIIVELESFGGYMRDRTKDFQRAQGVSADGVIGPTTARLLFRKRAFTLEEAKEIPNHWLAKIKTLESANDPVAEGWVDADDEGLLQFHMPYFPDLTLDDVWDPETVLTIGAERLKGAKTRVGSWKGAVAAHNIGETYAKKWVQVGYPASGGPNMGDAVNPIDAYARATSYVAVVDGSTV